MYKIINKFSIIFIVSLQVIMFCLYFYNTDSKTLHPHTVNQISLGINMDFKNLFFNDDIYKINQSDIDYVINNSYKFSKFLFYKFKDSKNLSNADTGMDGSDWGYAIIVKILTIFPGPDLLKIIIFHLLIHLIICNIISNKLYRSEKNNYLYFNLFYTLNPIVIYFIAFPNYYFLQSVAGFILLNCLLDKSNYKIRFIEIVSLCLLLIVRSTIISFILSYFIILIFRHYNFKKIISLFCLSIVIIYSLSLLLPSKNLKRIYHTMAIGVNAYNFDDSENYMRDDYIQDNINKYIKNNNIKTNCIKQRCGQNDMIYLNILEKELIKDFIKRPEIYIKNFIFNEILLFSPGYKSNEKILIYFSLFFGLLVIIYAIYLKKYLLILIILAAEISFTFYYPPVVAYRFGSIILLTYLCIELLNKSKFKIFSE